MIELVVEVEGGRAGAAVDGEGKDHRAGGIAVIAGSSHQFAVLVVVPDFLAVRGVV